MPGTVGQIEKRTQRRVVKLFREALGYDYLGDWTDREGNASIEPERRHDDRFVSLMDEHLPQWRHHRKTLNEAPLSHADWTY